MSSVGSFQEAYDQSLQLISSKARKCSGCEGNNVSIMYKWATKAPNGCVSLDDCFRLRINVRERVNDTSW